MYIHCLYNVYTSDDAGFDFDFNILTALKGWVGHAPQGRGALLNYYFLTLTLTLTLTFDFLFILTLLSGIFISLVDGGAVFLYHCRGFFEFAF